MFFLIFKRVKRELSNAYTCTAITALDLLLTSGKKMQNRLAVLQSYKNWLKNEVLVGKYFLRTNLWDSQVQRLQILRNLFLRLDDLF